MIVHCAGVAQSAERILGKDKVTGSIPVTSSIHGGIAQLARAIGSYPVCPRFKSAYQHQPSKFLFPLLNSNDFIG